MSKTANIPVLIKQLGLSLDQYERAQLRGLGISPPQGLMLHYLFEHPSPVCATQLQACFGLSKSAVSATVQGLRQKGYLVTSAHPQDDRKKCIYLTDKAYAMQRHMEENLRRQQIQLCRNIPSERLEILEHDLRSMLQNLEEGKRGDRHA